jgi:tripartite-type tricarboxylate transporter receptor subunit TctC
MKIGIRLGVVLAALWVSFGLSPVAAQESYPSRPMTMIVPFAAGNVTDTIARIISERLSQSTGQPVVVDNRAGASGGIGMAAIAKAPPDGYTIGMGTIGPLSLNPALYSKLAYDPQNDFSILSVVYQGSYLVLVDASSPITSLKELVQSSQSQPNGIEYASPGVGSMQHLTAELFQRSTGSKLLHVPNRGSGQATTLLLGKHVPVLFEVTTVALPFIRSGQMRALAISSEKRLPTLPNVPTFAEAGYPGVITEGWLAVVAPAGISNAVRQKLSDEIRKIMGSAEVQAMAHTFGGIAPQMTLEQANSYVRAEGKRWFDIIRSAGIKLE